MASRVARIKEIRKKNMIVEGYRGHWRVRLFVEHQSFILASVSDKRSAKFIATSLAIALNRFKNGD